jgi:hypothetical protein
MVVTRVGKILSSEELMKHIFNMDSENSVFQFTIPGKGKFTLVLQEEEQSIEADARVNPGLEQMLKKGEKQYKKGLGITTSEFLETLSEKDFM